MDKLNQFIGVLKKHYFWILLGLAAVICLITWTTATAGLVKQFNTRKKAIDGRFDDLNKVAGTPEHPNKAVIEVIKGPDGQGGKIGKAKANVLEAWKLMYKAQTDKNRLSTGLSPEFRAMFESLKPGERLPVHLLADYQNFIREHVAKLPDRVKYRHRVDETPAGGTRPTRGGGAAARLGFNFAADDGPGPGAPPPMAGVGGSRKAEVWEGIVDWDPSSREALQKRYEFEQLPTTEEVLLAQEDLWVYEAILNVVTATNEGAKGPADAAVRRISSIQIGRDAIGAWTRSGRSAIQSTMSPSGEDPITFATPKPAGGAAAAERARPAAKDLTSNRYVDDNGKPLAQSDKSPYAEFKMMPVVLELTVDERRIPDLLVNCANSNMPIEVRMIRLRPGAGEAQQLAAGLNVAAGTGHTPPAGTMARTDSLAFDMPIEIQGLIYIYNPPDEKQLGTGAAAAETAGAAAGSGAATTETPTPKTTPATPKNGAGGATQGGGQTTPPANDATTPNGTTPPATGTAPTASGGQTPGAGGLPAGGQPAETGGAAHGQQPTGGAL